MQIHSRHATDRQWKPISSHKRRFISRLRPSALNTAFVLFLTQRRAQGPERTGGREGGKAPNMALIENLQRSDEGIPPYHMQLHGLTEKRKSGREFYRKSVNDAIFKDYYRGNIYFYIKM